MLSATTLMAVSLVPVKQALAEMVLVVQVFYFRVYLNYEAQSIGECIITLVLSWEHKGNPCSHFPWQKAITNGVVND
jgi:hypothetical protein